MNQTKTIAILGATGAQGGSLAHAILKDSNSEFKVRAITRNPDSEKSKALVEAGAEVVAADLDNTKSLEKAFDGAYGVFAVTNYWEHFSPEKETQQAKNIANAAKSVGVKHVIWSSFEDTREKVPIDDDLMPTLMNHYKVPHFDSKGEANKYFMEIGVPTTLLFTSFYWDNLIHFGMGPKPGADGVLAITFPLSDKKLSGIAAADIGKCAYGIFKSGDRYINKTVGIAGEHLTGQEMADALSKALGQKVNYNNVSADVYRGFGFPGADDLGNMFQYKRDFNEAYCAARNLHECKKLNPELQSFEDWLKVNKDKIDLN
jgi:uncharacterized protein YbjT (DUF2867 family)